MTSCFRRYSFGMWSISSFVTRDVTKDKASLLCFCSTFNNASRSGCARSSFARPLTIQASRYAVNHSIDPYECLTNQAERRATLWHGRSSGWLGCLTFLSCLRLVPLLGQERFDLDQRFGHITGGRNPDLIQVNRIVTVD
jgi:hypothetical protein